MARVNHRTVRQLLNRERSNITDKQFFVSRILAGHFSDVAAAQSRRYGYHRRVNVRIVWEPSNPDTARTDNALIWINAASSLVKECKTRPERYAMVSGLFAHELGHVLYSDFLIGQTYANRIMDGGWYPDRPAFTDPSLQLNVADIEDYRKASAVHQRLFTRFAHDVHNILEDGYVETQILAHFPGVLGNNLAFMRDAVWDDFSTVTELIEREEDDERLIWPSIRCCILSYCLYGEIKYGDEPLSDERVQATFRCLDQLDKGVTTTDARVRWHVTNQIIVQNWGYIKPYLERCEEQSQIDGKDIATILDELLSEMSGATAEASGTTEALPPAGSPPANASSPAATKRIQTAALASGGGDDEHDPEPEEAGSPAECADAENAAAAGVAPSLGVARGAANTFETVTAEECDRIPLTQTDSISVPHRGEMAWDDDYRGSGYDAAARDVEDLLDRMASVQLETRRTKSLNELAESISYGDAHEGVKMTVHRISHVDGELKDEYDQIAPPLLSISKQLQRSIEQQLHDQRRGGKQTGLYMGRRLDVHALPRNDGRVFTKTSLPNETPELAVGLLLDESGSMSGSHRATYARAAAIILYDFCQALDIPIMVYGHSTNDSGVDLYSYAEFEAVDRLDRYRMMDISSRGCNRDGAALRYVAEQLCKRPEDIKLLILVSDGQPSDTGYTGTAAEEDLRGIKTEYRRKGICFIAAAIGEDQECIERIYGNSFLNISDLTQLLVTLTAMVKRFIRA